MPWMSFYSHYPEDFPRGINPRIIVVPEGSRSLDYPDLQIPVKRSVIGLHLRVALVLLIPCTILDIQLKIHGLSH